MKGRAEEATAASSDPWGIRAWARRQPDALDDIDPDTQAPAMAIAGNIVEALAKMIATAAGLLPDSRVNWDALGAWCRDGST